MPINTVIIEDEEKSLYVLHEFIRQLAPDLQLCGTASHEDSAVRLITKAAPQLVFLDICIGDGLGFDVLRKLPSRDFELICITAYHNYAMEAFRYSAIDYLLKPLGMQEFEEAVERVRKRLVEKVRYNTIETLVYNLSQTHEYDKKISIPTLTGYDFIDLRNILWCRSDGPYTVFHLDNKSKTTSSRNLGEYEDLLCNNHFFRIHHSIIINMRCIKSYVKGKGGYVVMNDGTELEISQRRKTGFLDKLMI